MYHKASIAPLSSTQISKILNGHSVRISAGNSNKALLTELHELLFKMVRVHLISKNAAAAYYKNIKDNFFTL